ncbi:phosphate ABC transporter substrate-binding/OmpA family protein [Psychromonas sp.]|nr:phosphate ABC transporter substrate-binding/OmpA family protein [Psychromonas sp.]
MSLGDSNSSNVTLNPDFKRKAIELKNAVKTEFDIHLSIDKLVLDEQYRQTVFAELKSLNNTTITQQIKSLENTSIYVEPAHLPINQSNQKERPQVVSNPEKNGSKLTIIALSLACLLFAFFVLIQTNIIQFNGYSNIQNEVQPSVEINVPQSVTEEEVIEIPIVEVPLIPAITLPVENAEMSMRLHGSNTVGEHLAPALLEGYLSELGVTEMVWVEGEVDVERQLQYILNNEVFAIELEAHGSSTAFKDLLTGEADLGMSSRQIKSQEVELLKAQYGNLGLAGSELIISLDGLATIINPQNPITQLTALQIAQIFSGEITNWQEVGGDDLPINIYARDTNSGTWDTFKNLVLKAHEKTLSPNAKRYESSSELSDLVANDKAGIGFIGLPYINNSKALSIAATDWSNPIYPTHFTVSTEDYPLARRLYMYVPSSSSEFIKGFTDFVVSKAGQDVVEKVGLVSQNIKLETPYKTKGAPKFYNDYTEVASRLSVNFRFESGSNKLDSKGQRDVLRLVDYMMENPGRRVVLMGFSDALGDDKKNMQLSIMRANVLEKELVARGINITAVEGLGSQLPIASNKNALGRSKNRRVEVWVF